MQTCARRGISFLVYIFEWRGWVGENQVKGLQWAAYSGPTWRFLTRLDFTSCCFSSCLTLPNKVTFTPTVIILFCESARVSSEIRHLWLRLQLWDEHLKMRLRYSTGRAMFQERRLLFASKRVLSDDSPAGHCLSYSLIHPQLRHSHQKSQVFRVIFLIISNCSLLCVCM